MNICRKNCEKSYFSTKYRISAQNRIRPRFDRIALSVNFQMERFMKIFFLSNNIHPNNDNMVSTSSTDGNRNGFSLESLTVRNRTLDDRSPFVISWVVLYCIAQQIVFSLILRRRIIVLDKIAKIRISKMRKKKKKDFRLTTYYSVPTVGGRGEDTILMCSVVSFCTHFARVTQYQALLFLQLGVLVLLTVSLNIIIYIIVFFDSCNYMIIW